MRRVLTLALAAAANALALETRSIGGWSALLEMPTKPVVDARMLPGVRPSQKNQRILSLEY